MKKAFYLFATSLLLGLVSSCSSDFESTDDGSISLRTSLTSVSDPAVGSTTTLNLLDDQLTGGITTTGGKYWANTYTPNTNVVSDIFTFSHSSMFDQYSYWDGFTVSNVNDITNYGAPGSSDGWVAHQWGCMPGSGVNTAGSVVPGKPGTSGAPFIVAYWSSYKDPKNPGGQAFTESTYSNWIKIGNTGTYQIKGLRIANHPWPYYGNLSGDGFARPLNISGDYFDLYIYGVKADNTVTTNKVTVSLAKNIGGTLTQSNLWITVNTAQLAALGNVKYLLFQMASSDSDPTWGMNTAAYFCLDKLSAQRIN